MTCPTCSNIWAPERQKPLVKVSRYPPLWKSGKNDISRQAIAAQYEFTPRLLGLMCADPLKPALVVVPDTPRSRVHDFLHHQKETERTSMQSQGSDPESPVQMTSIPTVRDGGLDLSHYKIINEVWHYSSVDWGHRCRSISVQSSEVYADGLETFVWATTRSSILTLARPLRPRMPNETIRKANGCGPGFYSVMMVRGSYTFTW